VIITPVSTVDSCRVKALSAVIKSQAQGFECPGATEKATRYHLKGLLDKLEALDRER
jgi:hypothetical protein